MRGELQIAVKINIHLKSHFPGGHCKFTPYDLVFFLLNQVRSSINLFLIQFFHEFVKRPCHFGGFQQGFQFFY